MAADNIVEKYIPHTNTLHTTIREKLPLYSAQNVNNHRICIDRISDTAFPNIYFIWNYNSVQLEYLEI